MFSVIVEPKEGERGLTERKVGMYQCPKCETKFPIVVSRQRYLIIAEDQVKQIQTDLKALKKDHTELKKQYEDLEKVLDRTKKESEVRQLEIKLRSLEEQITYLKKEKGELEQRVAKFS
jgi:chromosome segregation ATPase